METAISFVGCFISREQKGFEFVPTQYSHDNREREGRRGMHLRNWCRVTIKETTEMHFTRLHWIFWGEPMRNHVQTVLKSILKKIFSQFFFFGLVQKRASFLIAVNVIGKNLIGSLVQFHTTKHILFLVHMDVNHREAPPISIHELYAI
jgi:hypothetical protein